MLQSVLLKLSSCLSVPLWQRIAITDCGMSVRMS
jgi:hypothetical protein